MTPRILAVDTTTEFGSVALIEDAEVVSEIPLHAASGFAQVLFGHIERVLGDAGWTAESIDCFACAAGPGSFTGVRVGIVAVKGLAEALGKRALGVSNLQAIASYGSAALRAVVLDARRGQIFGAVYDARLELVCPEEVASFPAWLASLPESGIEFVATGFDPFRTALTGTRFANAQVTEAPRALAGAVGRIAAARLAAGETGDPAALDANYVRRSDAELFWKDA